MPHINSVVNIISSRLSLADKIKIKQLGPPQPNLSIILKKNTRGKVYCRKFSPEVYKKTNWICGCSVNNRLFCFPCLLFAKSGEEAWTKNGFYDLNHLSERIRRHEVSATHLNSITDFEALGEEVIRVQLAPDNQENVSKHNGVVRKNRYVLSQIINCIKFCGAFELVLRDSEESVTDSSNDPGIFGRLINFCTELNSEMKEHLKNASVFKETSKQIQEELLDSILHVIRSKIVQEINNAQFVAIIVEETINISSKQQLAVVFRYVVGNGNVVERFWIFSNPLDQTVASLANCIKTEIKQVISNNNKNKLVSQSYNESSVIANEHYSDVQSLIKTEYPYANFVHCYDHQLNLMIVQACSTNQLLRIFFSDISDINSFFSNSPKRISVLNEMLDTEICQSYFNTWNFHSRIIKFVCENYDRLILCFERIELISQQSNVISQARGLRLKLEQPDFKIWLEFFFKIMPHVDDFSSQLQKRSTGPTEIFQALNKFEASIISIRDSIDETANRTVFDEPPTKRIKKEDSCFGEKAIAKEMCDTIINQMFRRFEFSYHLLISNLLDSENFAYYHYHFPEDLLTVVCNTYPFFVFKKLKAELEMVYMRQDLREVSGAVTLLHFFIEHNLKSQLSEVIKLLTLLITIPMQTEEPQRNFSKLKRIKTFLERTFTEDRLTACAMVSIEKEVIKNISNFNDRVIDHFALKNNRMDFMYKTTKE